MPFEMPEGARADRRLVLWRWVSFAMVAILVAMLAYLGYIGFAGSERVVEPLAPSTDCRTPALTLNSDYEAINYDSAADERFTDLEDAASCDPARAPAGNELVTSDGVSLAGWYIPAASGMDPSGPTVILAHGHGSNKSEMLAHATLLHADYHLVLFDFRNHGQSEPDTTTVGVLERLDLRAVIDWLEANKGPRRIGLLGVSMGGAAAINEARGDPRVGAVVLDATHATLANALQARLDQLGYPLSLPASWSILFGGLVRTGQDMSAADPVQAVERYGDRPLLVISGGRDVALGSVDAEELAAAGREGGSDVELRVCEPAGHAQAVFACADEYRTWVLGFFGRTLGPGA